MNGREPREGPVTRERAASQKPRVVPAPIGAAIGLAVGVACVAFAAFSFQQLGSRRPTGASPLPMLLAVGWESAAVDPPAGIAALDSLVWLPSDPVTDQGPRGEVRWYRVRVLLSAGVTSHPLAFSARLIRDVDEVFFEGEKIGGLGSFPPRLDSAHQLGRLYTIPPRLTASAGPKTIAIRVWRGRRDGSIFREPPRLDDLSEALAARAHADQALVLFLGIGVTLGLVFFLFSFHARGSAEYPLFGVFSIALSLFAMTIHSDWAVWPVPAESAFRLYVAAAMACSMVYAPALRRQLRFETPARFHLYHAFFGLLLLGGLFAPRVEMLVWPSRIYPFVFLLLLLELLQPIVKAVREKRRRAPAILAGHLVFLLGVLVFSRIVPPFSGMPDEPRASAAILASGFLGLATTFLWAVSDQLTRFRVAALTDPATRLWNRTALFEEIDERAEQRRRDERSSFGLVLVDLDRFKELNDRRGHLAGDRLLVLMARALQDASRPGDFVARFGGDEFAVLLQGVDSETAGPVATRLHEALLGALETEAGDVPVTASLGAAVFSRRRHVAAADLFQEADHALYESKAAGKNRVTLFRTPDESRSSGAFARPGLSLTDRIRRIARGE